MSGEVPRKTFSETEIGEKIINQLKLLSSTISDGIKEVAKENQNSWFFKATVNPRPHAKKLIEIFKEIPNGTIKDPLLIEELNKTLEIIGKIESGSEAIKTEVKENNIKLNARRESKYSSYQIFLTPEEQLIAEEHEIQKFNHSITEAINEELDRIRQKEEESLAVNRESERVSLENSRQEAAKQAMYIQKAKEVNKIDNFIIAYAVELEEKNFTNMEFHLDTIHENGKNIIDRYIVWKPNHEEESQKSSLLVSWRNLTDNTTFEAPLIGAHSEIKKILFQKGFPSLF